MPTPADCMARPPEKSTGAYTPAVSSASSGGSAQRPASRNWMPFERNAPYSPTPDNRPEPLDAGPLALTRDARAQMSFGERAALEGVLGQLQPALALEIGTAEGGTLARIAAHSDEVHSIDVTQEAFAGGPPANVLLHTGPSAEVLPRLLMSFADAGRTLDFALVDGDHSFEGVGRDLRHLLRSPVTRRSAILVHDTMNPEIRAGIEDVGLDEYPVVVYFELDFVPGYVYREGVCRGAAWGGIGLILTDDQRSPRYAASARQRRYVEPFSAVERLRAVAFGGQETAHPAVADLESLRLELERKAEALEVMRRSRGWRLTEPARAAARWLRTRLG